MIQQLDRELGKIRSERDRLEKAVHSEGDGPGAREKILEACKGLEERLRAIRMTGREEYLVLRSLLTGLLAGVFVTNTGEIRLEVKLDGLKTSQDLTTGPQEAIFDRYLVTHLDGESSNGSLPKDDKRLPLIPIRFSSPELFKRTRRKKSVLKTTLLPARAPVIRIDTPPSTTEN